MISKTIFVVFSVSIPFLTFVYSIRFGHMTEQESSAKLYHNDLKLDSNYDVLVSWHAETPERYPKKTWKAVLAELQFGRSLKERSGTCRPNPKLDMISRFDARRKWKKCKSVIGAVYDQGVCKSDYAITAASVLADRLCIKEDGRFHKLLSAQNVMACYGSCSSGGFLYESFNYVKHNGTPTGGLYEPYKGCVPYEAEPCWHETARKPGKYLALKNCTELTPLWYECPSACTNANYRKRYEKDLHQYLRLDWTSKNECEIREEIYNNGPVGAAFAMPSDFRNYRSGLYSSSVHDFEYMHKMKLIGWGVENGSDYWLAVNSFNKRWGEKGLVKFPRGSNYLYIESLVIKAEPMK